MEVGLYADIKRHDRDKKKRQRLGGGASGGGNRRPTYEVAEGKHCRQVTRAMQLEMGVCTCVRVNVIS